MPPADARRDGTDDREVADEIASLGPWFQNIHLPGGRQTAPDHRLGDFPQFKWEQIAPHLPPDLNGWECLEIGCNAGFYSFQLARRGATVFAIDCDDRYLRQAEWACRQLGLSDRVSFRRMQLYELARLGRTFDLVLFMGVLYHLRYPLLALDAASQLVRRVMLFQTLTFGGEDVVNDTDGHDLADRKIFDRPGWPKMAFVEHRFANDPTNWWVPNHACCEAMLRSCGFRVVARPGHEMYLCEPDPRRPPLSMPWERDEYDSAIGKGGR